jgi:DNA modification methylase
MTSPPYWALRDYGVDGQLGLEPTFDEYINKLCNVFDEVKRVLRDDGTCWVNLGDCYIGGHKGGSIHTKGSKYDNPDIIPQFKGTPKEKQEGMIEKCLVGIPFRFALEMINRGWILRNTIIWYKPSCMPSSVKDRFTVDFEYIFFFSKKKKYHFETQREPHLRPEREPRYASPKMKKYMEMGLMSKRDEIKNHPNGRNKRTVWTINPKPFKEAHFAVYPEELCETPIKAGCPEQGIVLDPFFGAGTTGLVALKQNKKFIGIELNKEYIEIANKRLKPYLEQRKLKC